MSKYFAGPSRGKRKYASRRREEEEEEDAEAGDGGGGGETSESSDAEWEAVEDLPDDADLDHYKPSLPTAGVEITLSMPEVKKRGRKKLDASDVIRQELNRVRKKVQEDMHKTHILCLVAYGLYLNKALEEELAVGLLLSHSSELKQEVQKVTLSWIIELTRWYRAKFEWSEQSTLSSNLCDTMLLSLETSKATNEAVYVVIFAGILRFVFHVEVRLCIACDVVSLKPKDLILSEKQLEQKKRKRTPVTKGGSKKKKTDVQSGRKNRKVLSSDDGDDDVLVEVGGSNKDGQRKKAITHWLEVYSTSEKRWIPVDLFTGVVDEPAKIEKATVTPLLYVLAFDNDSYVKDITQRYCSNWTSPSVQKLRVDRVWLQETLSHFKCPDTSAKDIEEEIQFSKDLTLKPLPATLGEYKNHPLYVLQRHLLKYEVIYPPSSIPVGYFKSEPVYDRNCVQTVHSSLFWRRQARVVKDGEAPYKTSTARPKWDKQLNQYIRDLPLDLYGIWQTEPYVPPEAKDGKVPRNEYGNVELFQPSMLPKGTVHLKLSGLIRIANKLGIDCAPAVVAFDAHSGGGGTHPVFDGFIVCEEYRDVLIAAWDEEEENSAKRQAEKKEKRVFTNWRRLIKGAIIKARLAEKFK